MILITGGLGFVGQHLLEICYDKELQKQILCLDLPCNEKKLKHKAYLQHFSWKFMNLCDADVVEQMFAQNRFTTVVHLAAKIIDKNPLEMQRNNVDSTKNLISCAARKRDIRFIFVSSANVVENLSDEYTFSKRYGEYLFNEFITDGVIVRPPLIWGMNDKKGYAFIFEWMEKREWIPVLGSGEQTMNPIFVKDLAKFIYMVAFERKEVQGIFTVAQDELVSWNYLIDQANRIMGRNVRKIHFPLFMWKAAITLKQMVSNHLIVDPEKLPMLMENKHYLSNAAKRIGFKPTPFLEALEITLKSGVESNK